MNIFGFQLAVKKFVKWNTIKFLNYALILRRSVVVEVKKRKMGPSESSSSSDEDVQLRDICDDASSDQKSDVEKKCIILDYSRERYI
jgi:hypothetical protein